MFELLTKEIKKPFVPNVYAIDDDIFVRKYLSIILEILDCNNIGMTSDINYFRSQLANFDCDLILMDVCMPGVDGDDLLPFVRNLRPDIQVVMFTRVNSIELKNRCIQLGAFGYVLKQGSIFDIAEELSDILHKIQAINTQSV